MEGGDASEKNVVLGGVELPTRSRHRRGTSNLSNAAHLQALKRVTSAAPGFKESESPSSRVDSSDVSSIAEATHSKPFKQAFALPLSPVLLIMQLGASSATSGGRPF